MRISIAPYLPIVLHGDANDVGFNNLSLFDLPHYVTLVIAGNWDDILLNSNVLHTSYEMFRLLLELPVVEVSPDKKASYIKVDPDILCKLGKEDKESVRRQLFALFCDADSKRIFAGANDDAKSIFVTSDHKSQEIVNFNPYGDKPLIGLIDTYIPRLEQLKHYHNDRKIGTKDVAPFSAYDKNDEDYAEKLLLTAFVDHQGDVDDRTYLYTYDKKYKTFVQFRPGRNGIYHGMDINLEDARKKSPDTVRKFHK